MLNVAFAQGFAVEQWQLASCGENMGMGTWKVLADCAHMHGQHATTESRDTVSCRRFIVQRGEAGIGTLWHAFGVLVP
jgi:hypothetical protein